MRAHAWIALVALTLWCMGCSENTDPNAFVDRYIELHRTGDIDGLLALHTPDTEFLIPGQEPVRGLSALRDLLEWDAVLGSELVFDSIASERDTIRIDFVVERNKLFKGLGLYEARFNPGTRILLRKGRIKGTYLADFDAETQEHLNEEFSLIAQWLSVSRPGVLERLMPEGKFQYNAARARLWLEVLEEWSAVRVPTAQPAERSANSSFQPMLNITSSNL